MPPFASKDRLVCKNELIGCDDHVEGVFGIPPHTALFPFFDRAVVAKYLEPRQELFELHFPVEDDARRDDDQVRSPDSFVAGQVGEERDSLDGFAG